MDELFIIQKKCVRIMFGDHDYEAYLDKFRTCTRATTLMSEKFQISNPNLANK